MTPNNQRLVLPSGVIAVRYVRIRSLVPGVAGYAYAIHGAPAILLPADVEALYADSISGDGGRELPTSLRDRGGCNRSGCCASCHFVVHGQ